ncbi:MAG: SRPBCC family protein [Fimbriimonadaceae bacterium]
MAHGTQPALGAAMTSGIGGLEVTTPSDREIAMSRTFHAPRSSVFDALTRPELVRQWLLGPGGWSMPVCEIDLRVGGAYRYEWRNDANGSAMGVGGTYLEIAKPDRLVTTEKFDEAWYSGEALVTIALAEKDGSTRLTLTVLYDSKETRDAVLKTPMDSGVAVSYNRLEALLTE